MKNTYFSSCILIFILLLVNVQLVFSQSARKKTGKASYYHHKFNGRKTSTGEVFNNKNYTAASNIFPLGTKVRVTNKHNGKSVIVRINDRMSANNKRIIDLSTKAAEDLCFLQQGICTVEVEPILSQNETDKNKAENIDIETTKKAE